jgi:hypothetical protein
MTLRKQEDTGSWRRKLRIALFGEPSLEEAIDLSQDRLLLDLTMVRASEGVMITESQNAIGINKIILFTKSDASDGPSLMLCVILWRCG